MDMEEQRQMGQRRMALERLIGMLEGPAILRNVLVYFFRGTEGSEIELSEYMKKGRRPSNPQSTSVKWMDFDRPSREGSPEAIKMDD